MKAALVFLILLVPRLCIPFSFLLAIVFAPVSALRAIGDWSHMLADMWDDPI